MGYPTRAESGSDESSELLSRTDILLGAGTEVTVMIQHTAGHCEGQAKKNASPTFSMENGSLGCPELGEVCHKFRLRQN